MNTMHIASPIDAEMLEKLTTGTRVLISGVVYTARDAAHQRLVQALDKGETLPFDLKGQTIYYMGPSPAKPGQIIGSAGPTTRSRMDNCTPRLIASGITAKPQFDRARMTRRTSPPAGAGTRRVYFQGAGWVETAVYSRDAFSPGNRIEGPAIIEQYDATTVVPPEWNAAVDRYGNLRLRRRSA